MIDEEPTTDASVRARRLFYRGVIATIAYVGLMLAYSWHMRGLMVAMKPEEFATFLSGVFAPLAFLWLVLGFRQQGDELQNSARALWLQGEELRNSVEQQRALVEVSREQLNAEYQARLSAEEEADRTAQPHLMMTLGGQYAVPVRQLDLRVNSAGPTCSNVLVIANGEPKAEATILRDGEHTGFGMVFQTPVEVRPLEVDVAYNDLRGNRRAQKFLVPVDEKGGPDGDRTLGAPVKLPGYEKIIVGAVKANLEPFTGSSE
jgi:hypothetical protein